MSVAQNYRFKVRGRLAASWTTDNEVLLDRELGLETDTDKFKFGDGVTAWNSLPYASEPTPTNVSAFTNDAGYITTAALSGYLTTTAAAAAYQPLDSDLTAIAALASAANKLPYATGSASWALTDFSAFGRSLVDDADAAAARTTLQLVIGTNVQAFDADLSAVAGLASNGLIVRTGSGTATVRTLTGTTNELTVTNGDGVSGNPTVSLPSAMTFTGKTITGGTFSGITLSGATSGPGGFGVDSSGFVTGGGTGGWTIGSKASAVRIDYNGTTFRALTAAGGNAPLTVLNLIASSLVQGATFRLEQTPVAQTITCTHTVVISVSGTNYLFPCRAA